jgi:iron complex transport system substrate-binding protein
MQLPLRPCQVVSLIAMKLWFLALVLCCKSVGACEVVDDLGRVVKLQNPAKRIVSLAPDITENLFAVGAGDHIVGVMQGSDYPLAAKKIRVVAQYNAIDSETILRLKPDLIVAWTDGVSVSQWEKWGIPVFFSRPKKLTDIPVTLKKLGCLVGNEKIANEAAKSYLERYSQLSKQYTQTMPVTVFYQIWSNPLMTVTKQSWIGEAITFCGGKNIFADLKGVSPEVSIESIVVANPDTIVSADKSEEWKKSWQPWNSLRAVKQHLLVSMDPDLIARASPRLLDGVSQLCRSIDDARKKLNDKNASG